MAEQGVPQIADISVQQAPQQNLALDDALSRVSAQAQAKLPSPYTQGFTQQQPRMPSTSQFQEQPEHQAPIGGGSAMLKAQDQRNNIHALSNMIGKAGQAIQQKKNDNLKADLTDVMQAKTNAENAMAVLKQDPNNKMAQGVLAANKKRLNDILSDPKKQKQLAKALDLSYTDPSQNKTPEIAAGQQAISAFKQAGPYNSSNPQEAKIAQQAQQPAKPQQPQSTTPRADQAIGRDLPSMESNPQYAPALAQQQAAQKALWTNIIPKAMQQQTDIAKTKMQQEGSSERANLTAQLAAYKEQAAHVNKMEEIGATGKNQMLVENARAASAMANTMARVNAAKEIASNKALNPENKLKMQTQTMHTIDQSVSGMIQSGAGLQAQLKVATDPTQQKLIQAQIDANNMNLKQTQDFREKTAQDFYKITGQVPSAPVQDGKQPQWQGWLSKFTDSKAANVLGGSAGTVGTGVTNVAGGSGVSATTEQSRPNIQVVGRDASDESSDDSGDTNPEDDPDYLGNN